MGKDFEVLNNYLDDNVAKEDQGKLRNAYGREKLNKEERVVALILNVIDRMRNPRMKGQL